MDYDVKRKALMAEAAKGREAIQAHQAEINRLAAAINRIEGALLLLADLEKDSSPIHMLEPEA